MCCVLIPHPGTAFTRSRPSPLRPDLTPPPDHRLSITGHRSLPLGRGSDDPVGIVGQNQWQAQHYGPIGLCAIGESPHTSAVHTERDTVQACLRETASARIASNKQPTAYRDPSPDRGRLPRSYPAALSRGPRFQRELRWYCTLIYKNECTTTLCTSQYPLA
jgi:hypothetical protein